MRSAEALLLGLLLGAQAVGAGERVEVAQFSLGSLEGWEQKSFVGQTEYGLRDGQLCASSKAAASGLFRKLEVDLERTPWLHWSWRAEQGFHSGDERSKAGDDYPARVYVVFSGGALFWRTRAINYVWASSEQPQAQWPNAFTANAVMIALRSGAQDGGQLLHERRDVRADYQRAFGAEPGAISAVAIMTDTDNTGTSASACYGDIWFGEE